MIGIVGFGFVGQAVYAALKGTLTVAVYDKYKEPYDCRCDELLKKEAIFVCVPTPTVNEGRQDASALIGTLKWLNDSCYPGLVVIKSTVLYEVAKPHIGKLKAVFNPEFLSQNNAIEDFKHGTVVLGGGIDVCRQARSIYERYFRLDSPDYIFCSAEEACQLKYLHNLYHAYKALFWNWALEVTGNHRKLFSLYKQVRPEPMEMEKVAADGKLGVGGACFPKDVAAFNHEHPHELTQFMLEYNGRLRPEYNKWSGLLSES